MKKLPCCLACGDRGTKEEFLAREMMIGTKDAFTYLRCKDCGSLQIAAVPPDLSKYYEQQYYSLSSLASGRFSRRVVRVSKKLRDSYEIYGHGVLGRMIHNVTTGGLVLQSLRPVGINHDSRILDVGCGTGVLLYSLKNLGFNNLLGVDKFIERDIEYENGLRLLRRTIHEVDQGNFDLIMFHHSIEHVSDPKETLQKASSLLKQGGVCLIRTPIVPSHAWEEYGTDWVQLDAPRHLVIFSVKGLKILGESVGLRLETVVFDSTEFQFWGSEQNRLGIPLHSEQSYDKNPKSSPFRKQQIEAWRREAQELNAQGWGDQAILYFRK